MNLLTLPSRDLNRELVHVFLAPREHATFVISQLLTKYKGLHTHFCSVCKKSLHNVCMDSVLTNLKPFDDFGSHEAASRHLIYSSGH